MFRDLREIAAKNNSPVAQAYTIDYNILFQHFLTVLLSADSAGLSQ